MAENQDQSQDRTEEATPERREEFREKGQIAVSKDLTSVFILFITIVFMNFYGVSLLRGLMEIFRIAFTRIENFEMNPSNTMKLFTFFSTSYFEMIAPIFMLVTAIAVMVTFLQTRFNFSAKKLKPDFSRVNPIKGLKRFFELAVAMELAKSILKITAISFVAYLVFKSRWAAIPGLTQVSVAGAWAYWWDVSLSLFWAVSALMLVISISDYLFQFFQMEQKLKMTKQEVKEEYKKREVDQHVKARLRRMQRQFATKKMVENTKDATVIITNPTHYAVALKYDLTMKAPIVLAKGIDYIALRMREVAKKNDIPTVENKQLARALYSESELDQEIGSQFFKAVSEIIRYVFKIKGIKV